MKYFLIIVLFFISFTTYSQDVCPLPVDRLVFIVTDDINNDKEIGVVYACDPDGDGIEWNITEGDEDNIFRIENGIIIVNKENIINNDNINPYSLTIKATDNGTPSLSSEVDVIIYFEESVSVKVYPNPFRDILNIDFVLDYNEHEINIEVLNHTGQHVKYITTKENLPSGFYNYKWNTNSSSGYVSAGVYYIRFTVDGTMNTYKVVLTK